MKPSHLHIDFETRSTVDLKKAGLDNYAKHPTTDVWCMGYAFDDERPEICTPDGGLPDRVGLHVQNGGIVVAHNAAFELAIWNEVMAERDLWPTLRPKQVRCTMAMAYAMGLPGALDNAAAAVGLAMRKDQAGYRLMMKMCRPRSTAADGVSVWWDDPADVDRLHEYCEQDVLVERALEQRLLPLSDDEQELWELDQRINQRGIYIDHNAVRGAALVVQAEQDRLNLEMRRVTNNYVGFCTETGRLAQWCQSRGVMIPGVAKAEILDALADGYGELPPLVREALMLRQEAGKSSTAKLRAMSETSSDDGRVRNSLQYHAASTGRWGGRRVQPHNMPRPKLKQDKIEEVLGTLGGVV